MAGTMTSNMTGHNGGHATHGQQQMHRDLQSIPDAFFKCDQCPAVFKRKFDLHRHYSQEHPARLKCYQCSNNFALDRDLELHERIHGDSFFKCDQCPQRFAFHVALSIHRRDQHAVNRFFCPLCEAPFAKENFLHVRFSPIDSANP